MLHRAQGPAMDDHMVCFPLGFRPLSWTEIVRLKKHHFCAISEFLGMQIKESLSQG